MKLISKKNNKKLIKGVIYDALKIETKKNNTGYFRPWVIVKINDTQAGFSPDSFTLTNGEPIPEMTWTSHEFQETGGYHRLDGSKAKVGDFVYCRTSSRKTLEQDKIYKISEIKSTQRGYSNHKWTEYKIKIEGSNIFYSPWIFRPCSQQEVRDIALKKLFDEKVDISKAGEAQRIIDRYEPKQKELLLLSLLINSTNDGHRHNMSVIDWAVRLGKKFSVTKEDFTPLLSKTISSIIE